MAKKKIEAEKNKHSELSFLYHIIHFFKSETLQFITGLLLTIFAFYILLSYTSFFITGEADQSIVTNPNPGELISTDNQIQNYAGARGAILAELLVNRWFGISSILIAVFFVVTGLRLMRAYRFKIWKWFISCSVLMIWCSILCGFLFEETFGTSHVYPGGLHGHNVSLWLVSQIGSTGVILLLLTVAILYLLFLSRETIKVVRIMLHPSFANKKKHPEKVESESGKTMTPTSIIIPETKENESSSAISIEITNLDNKSEKEPIPQSEKIEIEENTNNDDAEDKSFKQPTIEVVINKEETNENAPFDQPYNPRLDLENYHFPTIDLLNQYEDNTPSIDQEELENNTNKIQEVLHNFGVEISSIKATIGPTITLYEITPAQGVRIAKIRNLGSDIALSLAAKGIRIIAPIPGKGTIGIEVPNLKAKIVPIRDIFSSKKFQDSTFDLPIALGKTITNEVYITDLCKMPHVLVAGATGQGKSVGLNAIITSLLYKKHPSEVKFVMIDPKMVEFSMYNLIEKHFLAKLPNENEAIITEPGKVVQTLQSLCVEMDNRYELLKAANVRHIKEYNKKFINRQLNPEKGHRFLPYIVVIIDEFGDLIMTASKEIETPIARIAQKARAIGIHTIIATQRPSANIITSVIKANFPARIAFKVSSMLESRIILDTTGADQLIGRGDMLISQGNELTRIQCAFVDTPEVECITEYISRQQSYPSAFYLPEYVGEEGESTTSNEVDMNRLDSLFEDAARLIVTYQQGSTSLIQRKFSIGYNRAGRIMDQLEQAGIVGPSEGAKARQVLCMDEMDLEMRLQNIKQ